VASKKSARTATTGKRTSRTTTAGRKSSRKKTSAKTSSAKKRGTRYWSARVTATSDALDIPGGTFAKDDPRAIAHELEHDAETSTRRKTSPYRSAMSMLTFYINRAGKNLAPAHRKILEQAKDILRDEFGPQSGAAKKTSRKKSTAKKTSRRKTSR
jgi:putative cell wall-binding protein